MKPTLLLDLQACQSPESRQRGIGRYVWHLFEALWPLLQQRYRVAVLCSAAQPVPRHGWLQRVLAQGEAPLVMLEGLEPGTDPATRKRNQQRYVAVVSGYEAVLIGSPFEDAPGIAVPDSRDGLEGVSIIAVLYDLIPYLFRERYLSDPVHSLWYYARLQLLREADGLLAISEATRRDAISHLDIAEQRVSNIFGGVGPDFSPLRPDEEAAAARTLGECGIERPFLFYTGGDDWRKNINGLIEAYARLAPALRDAHQLVIVCRLRPEALDAYRAQQRRCGLPDDAVVFPGYVSDDALRHLCATCVGLVFPSYYEGFGLPVAEALACGRPAVVADAASLPELVPDPAARFDPADPAEMARVMERLLVDTDWREHLMSEGRATAPSLTWHAVAERAAAALDRMITPRTAPARPKPRLALFAPIPPQASGIADYTASLALQLARHYRITWVIAHRVDAIPPMLAGVFEIVTAEQFSRAPKDFDQYLYQVGNSDFHLYQLPFAVSHPGAVVLHEIGLEGMAWLAEEWLPGGIAALYPPAPGAALRSAVSAAGHAPPLRAQLLADALLWRLVASARGLIVHSHHALELLQRSLSQAPRQAVVIGLGATLAGPPPGGDEKRRLRAHYGLPEGAIILGAFGILDPIKGIDLLVEAVGMLPADLRRRLCVLLAGPCDQADWLAAHQRTLNAAGVANRHTGRLAEADFIAHLRLADLGVSLRSRSRGESSYALIRQMAQGLPTVATDLGSFAEIADTAVVKVPPNDPAVLSDRIRILMDDPLARQALAERAIDWLRQRHWPRVADAYRDQLQAL